MAGSIVFQREIKVVPFLEESRIQQEYFKWVRLIENQDWRYALIFAVVNGANVSPKNRGRLCREGLRKGVSDVLCLYPNKGFTSFCAEFKRPGGKLSDEQEKFLADAAKAGAATFVWRDLNSAINDTQKYFAKK